MDPQFTVILERISAPMCRRDLTGTGARMRTGARTDTGRIGCTRGSTVFITLVPGGRRSGIHGSLELRFQRSLSGYEASIIAANFSLLILR
jgi:hypothetical protein